jgi:hypothetical protein
MTRRVIGDLVLAQACLLGGLLLCIAFRPDGLGANDGISYYGIFRQTVIPYAIAILGSAIFMRRALRSTAPASAAPNYIRGLANLVAAMSAGVVLTPYSLNTLFDWVHTALGAAVFALQLVLAWQFLGWTGGDNWIAFFFGVQFLSGVVAAVFVLPKHGFLIQAQVAFQFAFGALLIRTARLLLPEPETEAADQVT